MLEVNQIQGMQVMSAKKHKRKSTIHNHHTKNPTTASLISRYPRLFLAVGALLILVSLLLLTIGYISDARVGLAMIALFFGGAFIFFANSVLPKNRKVSK